MWRRWAARARQSSRNTLSMRSRASYALRSSQRDTSAQAVRSSAVPHAAVLGTALHCTAQVVLPADGSPPVVWDGENKLEALHAFFAKHANANKPAAPGSAIPDATQHRQRRRGVRRGNAACSRYSSACTAALCWQGRRGRWTSCRRSRSRRMFSRATPRGSCISMRPSASAHSQRCVRLCSSHSARACVRMLRAHIVRAAQTDIL